jgi:hypothetical protein
MTLLVAAALITAIIMPRIHSLVVDLGRMWHAAVCTTVNPRTVCAEINRFVMAVTSA